MIELNNLLKQYTMGDEVITAVNYANLTVNSGDYISIVGPSGSGKSTLMNIIGLLDTADGGTYRLNGIDVTNLSDNQQAEIRNEKIGFIFQNYNLLQKLTATENVMVPLLYRGIKENEARRIAEETLERMMLADKKEHRPNQLSGGQQQRVAIARALAGSPDLILADEPTGALDQHTGREIMNLLKHLNEEGQTIIVITHDRDIAHQMDRVIFIEDGMLSEEVRN